MQNDGEISAIFFLTILKFSMKAEGNYQTISPSSLGSRENIRGEREGRNLWQKLGRPRVSDVWCIYFKFPHAGKTNN